MEILQRGKFLGCKVSNVELLWYSESHIMIDRQTRSDAIRHSEEGGARSW